MSSPPETLKTAQHLLRVPELEQVLDRPALDHPGATYWTLRFLEFLPTSATSSANLVEFGGAGTTQSTLSAVPSHLVRDRCYVSNTHSP